jgi:tRNA pseudouridine55 synthase
VALPEVDFRVRCSKGTYIRQLCVDIGEKLGCGACLGALRRTMSGGFSLAGALRFDELKSLSAAGLEKRLLTNP